MEGCYFTKKRAFSQFSFNKSAPCRCACFRETPFHKRLSQCFATHHNKQPFNSLQTKSTSSSVKSECNGKESNSGKTVFVTGNASALLLL